MNEKQRKKAQRKKRKDGRINRKIIQAAKQKRYYDVLGVRSWEGPWHMFRLSQGDLRKAYRSMAKRVHPDKNSDGRAVEAFRHLEESAVFLLDDSLRHEYDQQLAAERNSRKQHRRQFVSDSFHVIYRSTRLLSQFVYRLVRPISTPIAILGPLLL